MIPKSEKSASRKRIIWPCASGEFVCLGWLKKAAAAAQAENMMLHSMLDSSQQQHTWWLVTVSTSIELMTWGVGTGDKVSIK